MHVIEIHVKYTCNRMECEVDPVQILSHHLGNRKSSQVHPNTQYTLNQL